VYSGAPLVECFPVRSRSRNREWKGVVGGGRMTYCGRSKSWQSYEYEYEDYKVNLKWKGRATKTLSGTELCRPLRLPEG